VTVRNSSGRARSGSAPGAGIADIGEPLDLGRHLRQLMEFGGGQEAICRNDFGGEPGVEHRKLSFTY
jgi:hypothetical protein